MKRSGDVEGLLCILEAGDVKEVREAVRILGELRYRKAIRPLVGLLEKDDIQVRANSAWSLGEIGDAKAVLPLIGLLNDPSENVQIYAAWALGRIGDKRAVTALESMLESGSIEVRKHAKEAIDRIESGMDGKKNRGNGNYRGEEERISSSDPVEIPLVTLDVPMDRLDCDYITRAEGNSKTGKVKFSGDVAVKDIINANQNSTRRVILGLKNDFNGFVSVDILLRYRDGEGDTSSVWMRVATPGGNHTGSGGETARARVKPGRKQAPRQVDYEVPEYRREEPEREDDVMVEIKPEAAPPAAKVIEKPPAAPLPAKAAESVDSAVRLLSDIGMSGMTGAASAVTQLGGEEAESLQSRLRTLPIDQINEEIVSLGEYVASVEVKLHGKSESGEMNGAMIMFFTKDVALSIANELLGNQPGSSVREFTEDITSTLMETVNIFGGQYVSAISEYIEMPILLKAPGFKTGASLQIAESMMKEIAGKVDFALATDLAFGNNKTGRLVMLLDPRSYDSIITKLF